MTSDPFAGGGTFGAPPPGALDREALVEKAALAIAAMPVRPGTPYAQASAAFEAVFPTEPLPELPPLDEGPLAFLLGPTAVVKTTDAATDSADRLSSPTEPEVQDGR